MRQRLWFAPVLALLVGASGCARGPVNPEQAEVLARWIREQSYSSWSMYRHRDRAPHEPASPDGLTLGSPNVFAAISCNPNDLTALDVFWGDERTERPLAKSLTVAVKEAEMATPLADFADQTLRRVRHTSISVAQVEDEGLRVSSVDFAPMDLEDNLLARWFLVENIGDSERRLSLEFRMNARGEWARKSAGVWATDNLALVSDVKLTRPAQAFEAALGSLRPGERAAAALLLVAAHDPGQMEGHLTRAKTALGRLRELLEETRSDWEAWCARTPLITGDERTDDLLDSLLCLVRSHVGTEAVHTGSLRYPHNRAWIRDSYWVQRALWELGRREEARVSLDFFHRAWRKSGIASYYEIPSGKSTAYGYSGVELPHYLVLMVKDAERFGGVDPAEYWDMIQACLDKAAVPESGLQPMNGDETWLLAAPVRELDQLLDNSWLLIASGEYGAKLAERMGDGGRAARYGAMAYRARLALTQFQPAAEQPPWYAIGRGADGTSDFALCPEVFARGAIMGVLPPEALTNALVCSWDQLSFSRGIRTHARSATISGGTPGYVLYAAARDPVCDSVFARELTARMLEFASATGCVWEFHDLHDPAWGGEKRRLWDSAVLLLGMVHALFEVQRIGGEVTFAPRPPPLAVEFERPPGAYPLAAVTAEALLAQSGPALILHERSPEHAARIARELLRQCSQQYAISSFLGDPPTDRSAVIISPAPPAEGWRAEWTGYWSRDWEGPPQFWVVNHEDVYRDTEPLLRALLSSLTPQRDQPLPFPDANLDLVTRHGEPPTGRAEVAALAGATGAAGRLDLGGSQVRLPLAGGEFEVEARPAEGNLLKLIVTAPAGRSEPAEIGVTLPPGWWLVFARDMTGKWDRVADPVAEYHLPNGGIRLVYHFRPSKESLTLTFDLAKLRVAGG